MKAKRGERLNDFLRILIGAVDVILVLLSSVLFFAFLADTSGLWPPFKLVVAVVVPIVLTRWVAHLIESEVWRG